MQSNGTVNSGGCFRFGLTRPIEKNVARELTVIKEVNTRHTTKSPHPYFPNLITILRPRTPQCSLCQQEPYHYFAGWLSTDPANLRNGRKSNPQRIVLQYGLDPGTGAVTPEKTRQIYATLAKPVQELQDYIEEIPEVYAYFSQMVDQVPSSADLPVRTKWVRNHHIWANH